MYRYGTRRGNLTFFENKSLNRELLSLYDVKVEKVLKMCRKSMVCGQCYAKEEKIECKTIQNAHAWTVFYEKRKKYRHFVFKQSKAVEC